MNILPDIERYIPGHQDDVCVDAEAHEKRQKVLATARYNSFFFGLNQVLTAISGVMVTFGMTMVGVAAKTLYEGGKSINFAALAGDTAGTIGLSTLGVAAGVVTMAVAAHQISSRVAHAVSYDQSEINAQHTAKYIAKELRKEMESVASAHQFENQGRADGKSWTEYVSAPQPANQNLVQRS